MMQFLVHNKSKNSVLALKDEYKLFNTFEEAVKYAKTLGWDDPFGLFKNITEHVAGRGSMVMHGDVNIVIVPLEVS